MATLTETGTSRFVRVGDLTLHYNEAGTGETLVMLHGSGPGASGWGNFYRNIDHFVDAGYRVILLDMPGFNKSSEVVVEEARDVHHARVLCDFLDTLGIARAHVIGNSMGGCVTLAFAIAHPERIGKQILIGAGSVGPSILSPFPTEGLRSMFHLYKAPSRENLDRMLEVFVYNPDAITEELRSNRMENLMRNTNHLKNFLISFQAVGGKVISDLSGKLPEVNTDTLITWGRDDRFMPIDFGLRLATLLPNAQLHVFNRCGHWGQWEQAERFNRLVVDFLKH